MSTTNFSELSLNQAMLKNLESLGYLEMTPIQAQSLPLILGGKDVIAKAKTGSGKTAAFAIGLLSKLNVKLFRVQALVLCPTRELADQVSKEIRRLARATHNVKVLTLCGGMPFGPQLGSLEHGAHIVVGTPGRIHEHIRKRSLRLDNLKTLVLDEADRMLDMGFEDAINAVVEQLPSHRQTLLFSATYPDAIVKMSEHFQYKPVEVHVESVHDDNHIEQVFYQVEKNQRMEALSQLLAHHQPKSAVVFCNTKRECQTVADYLFAEGHRAVALHGDLEQRQRDQTLVLFANGSRSILVATDVAARGLDVKDLQMVINYDLTRDAEVHVHRIGRTGRAGQQGLALSLFTVQEAYRISAIEEYLQMDITPVELPKNLVDDKPYVPQMVTLCIDGGRKNKVRPGDLLGALTGKSGIDGKAVGKIDLFDFCTYVAIDKKSVNKALSKLSNDKIKGRKFKVRKLD
jgi:ATP-independent RNA helicase DbpA